MLVDVPLKGVNGARLYFSKSHGPAGDVRFEERIDQRDVTAADLPIHFRRRAISNAPGQLYVFQSDQLAVGRSKVELVGPGSLGAEERGGDRLQQVARCVIQHSLVRDVSSVIQHEADRT